MPFLKAVLALVFATASIAYAEDIAFFQVEDVVYDEAVPAPEDHFGFGLGDRPVRIDQMVSYLTEIADMSDRISVETIGYSHERRPILFFVITSPENHARIEDIRTEHLAQLDPDVPQGDGPSILWLNYGVHGAESAGMDAAIPVLYHFAAAQGDAIEEQLDDSVLLITAIFNPDGHARRVNHVEMFASSVPVTDPVHAQHTMWIEARTNHFWFDLNRQWLLLTQPESRAWLEQWHRWKPQVSGDFHEMGTESTYYFHPGEPLRRNPLIPERARELTLGIAQHHIAFLDREARLYTAEEGFDNYYVGKGSTYPQVNGSLGILFEVGAARGGRIEAARGIVTYADNIRTHFRTSLTTIDGARAQREEIAAYQRQFFADSLRAAREDETRAYVFTAEGDPARLNRFLDLLIRHDIRVNHLARDLRADGYLYPADNSYLVQLTQPQYTMIRGLFDRVTDFEENVFYDVSGWTMPLAFDLEYSALSRLFASDLIGEIAEVADLTQAPPPVSNYGYAIRWSDYYAPRALYRLLDAEVRVRVATQNTSIETASGTLDYGPGTVFVPLAGQDVPAEEIHDLVSQIAAEDGIRVEAVTSGSTSGGSPDLGDRSGFRSVRKPEVLVLFDDGLTRYDAGEVWHQLDHRMQIPVTLRRKSRLGGIDWSRYTHLVIVGGGNTSLATSHLQRIQQWIREDGGVVIGIRQAAAMLQEEIFDATPPVERDDDADEDEPARRDYADMSVDDAAHVIGGAIFAGDMDPSHPIGFGYANREISLHRNTSLVLERPENDPFAVVVQYADDPLLSGYASDRRLDEIGGTPAVIAQRMGRGSVILFADNPVFRATFAGTEKMFMNAIFFGQLINRPNGSY